MATKRTAIIAFLWAFIVVPASVVSEPTDYVIFTAKMASSQVGEHPARALGVGELPYFEPSASSIESFKIALSAYVQANTDVSMLNLAVYKYQFIGLAIEGERALFANAFCPSQWRDDPTWRANLVVVDDGGNCYFQAAYDPKTKLIIWLYVHGWA